MLSLFYKYIYLKEIKAHPLKAILKKILLSVFPYIIKKRIYKDYNGLNSKNISSTIHDGELLLLKYLLNTESVFFDIGSNTGTYAYFAEKIIAQKNIYLFEPEKELFFQLRQIYSQAHVFNMAMSNKTGLQQFKIPYVNGVLDKSLSTLEIHALEKNETKNIIYEVTTDSLDAFTKTKNIFPDLIKIDVEGHEQTVLKGAEAYINNHFPTMIIEIEQRHHPNTSVESVFKSLLDLNYQCYYFSKPMNKLFNYTEKAYLLNDVKYFGTKDYVNNYIFIHASNKSIVPIEKINELLIAE
jgi:FkbM family methyltransferase